MARVHALVVRGPGPLAGGRALVYDHLHNGDPLTARTTHVPAGRPVANPRGEPEAGPRRSAPNPYTWEESAADALCQKGLNAWADWTIVGSLFQLEAYNGWGYRMYHSEVLSPYLWSFTNHYTKGKYASDGKWGANLVAAPRPVRRPSCASWSIPAWSSPPITWAISHSPGGRDVA